MLNDIKKYDNRMFEDIKHIDEDGNEYWYARELQNVFEYTQWRRFENTITKAKTACNNSNEIIENHFVDIGKMIYLGKGGTMPEELPTSNKSLKRLEKEQKDLIVNKN